VAGLFAGDAIWHYTFSVRRPSDVVAMHEELQALSLRNGEDPAARLEFEFVVDLGAGDRTI
jgi:hypothetical protein